VGNSHRRGRVTSCHLIWLLSFKLGSWSCQLWYQHPLQLLTLWTKRDSGLLRGIVDYRLRGTDTGGGEWHLAIWFDCSALNWDRGLVNCGTNILHGCWLFGQNKIQVYCGALLTIICGEQTQEEKSDVSPFDLIAHR
jgi:hypothetical protein